MIALLLFPIFMWTFPSPQDAQQFVYICIRNICWHVTITMTHYLLTAATSNGKNTKLHSQSLQFLHLWATASCACEAGSWYQIWCVPGQEFSFTTVTCLLVFLWTSQTSWGGICHVVALWGTANNVYYLGVISATSTQAVRCWRGPKKNTLQLIPISLQLVIAQLWTQVSPLCDCWLLSSVWVGNPAQGTFIFHCNKHFPSRSSDHSSVWELLLLNWALYCLLSPCAVCNWLQHISVFKSMWGDSCAHICNIYVWI